ncbi:tetratricopeptide repeat protein [Hymenobacter sp. J193]|uniref:tetratricopeptide repeat protein n=1 Tax=Hymenobacter sp. J193 TaxID=2898429 RepID=UPI002150A021|nr:tetratricopeptide repeat protein [Hymenobacter sp. J193]MCR5888134.1 tetratricopeptide repeat protein [Hymenobacter sp. J193]
MRSGFVCFLVWCAASAGAWAQTSPTEATVLKQADALLAWRKYEAAFQLLQVFDPWHRQPAVALRAADIALRYHTQQQNFRAFNFKDLTLTESLDSLRRHASDSVSYQFPVGQVLDSLHRRFPANYKVEKALADYYFELQQCACSEEEFSEDELFQRMVSHYRVAHGHGYGDYLSYYALGYAFMRLGDFPASAAAYERSIALRKDYALAHFQLAYDYLELKRLPEARDQVQLAVALFKQPQLRTDAEFLLAELEHRLATPPAVVAPPAESQTVAPDSAVQAVTALRPASVQLLVPELRFQPDSVEALAPRLLQLVDTTQAPARFPQMLPVQPAPVAPAPAAPPASGFLLQPARGRE